MEVSWKYSKPINIPTESITTKKGWSCKPSSWSCPEKIVITVPCCGARRETSEKRSKLRFLLKLSILFLLAFGIVKIIKSNNSKIKNHSTSSKRKIERLL